MPSLVDDKAAAAGPTSTTNSESAALDGAAPTEAAADRKDVTMADTVADGATTDTAASAAVASKDDTTATASNTTVSAPTSGGKSLGKQAKKPSASPTSFDVQTSSAASASQAIAAANLAAAVQTAASLQLNGLLSILTQSSTPGSASAADPTVLQTSSLVSSASLSSSNAAWQVPTIDQVRQAALKAVQDAPPLVHLSKTDAAPQLKVTEADRLTLKGGMRGYRMARATHGVSHGQFYFEVVVLPPPPIAEIVNSLPPNARLGPTLQRQIQHALEYAKQHPHQQQPASAAAAVDPQQVVSEATKIESASTTATEGTDATMSSNTAEEGANNKPGRKRKAETDDDGDGSKKAKPAAAAAGPPQVGGHLRIGWSMRTGDLQAPVGYDKWSYGFRSLGGSKIHQSRREDAWGGESWGPGDVVGCAIFLNNGNNAAAGTPSATDDNNMSNHIRFFKNGVNMGHFVISKGKREGGAAFEDIQHGTYYPAISSYLGGAVQVNYGPHFVHPPRKLPHGMNANTFQPISSLQPPPLSQDEILARLKKKAIFSRVHAKEKDTPETKMTAFKEAVLAESQVLRDAYQLHKKKHLQFVLQARKARNLNTAEIQEELDHLDGGSGAEAMEEDFLPNTNATEETATGTGGDSKVES